ncbi:MAG: hypothetical protein B5M54_03525 [Candidatus Aminicenantes bacterium 4484_214]|nr:MAG: hypothetical protein B5M54_03525 [Candidatus Aminicenantes bacterium 4484_214]
MILEYPIIMLEMKKLRKKGWLIWFAEIILFLTILGSCDRKIKNEGIIRLIDNLDKSITIESPLLPFRPQMRNYDYWQDIVNNFSIKKQRESDNVHILQGQLSVGQGEMRVILAPPFTRLVFPVEIKPNTNLEFTYGIRRDNRLLENEIDSRKTTFEVNLITDHNQQSIFRKTLILSSRRAMVFNFKRINLSSFISKETKKVRLEFITKGDDEAVACWINPLVYQPDYEAKNVVLVSLDTLRADHLSCYGYSRKTSPNLDALAREGFLFEKAIAPSPWTLPSHVSMLTGLRTINHQVTSPEDKMSDQLETLAEVFSRAGYATVALTGGGYLHHSYGFSQGFDHYLIRGEVNNYRAVESLSENVNNWIERLKDRPFFLFIHTYQIHSPYHSPPPYNRRFLDETAKWEKVDLKQMRLNKELRYKPLIPQERKNIIDLYDGEIVYTDDVLIKSLIAELRRQNLYDRTLIAVTSDHGEEFYEHRGWSHSHNVYNELLRVPLIIKNFNSYPQGKRIKQMVRMIDLFPTILEACGWKSNQFQIDGQSLWPLIRGGERIQQVIISDLGSRVLLPPLPMKISLIKEDYKLIINEPYRPEELKYFSYPPPVTPPLELYNLAVDFSEKRNLIEEKPEIARRLLKILEQDYRQKTTFTSSKKKDSDKSLEEQLRALGYIK